MGKVTDNTYVLKPGELVRNEKGMILFASSSVILMVDEFPLVVDTGLKKDWKRIQSELKNAGFSVEDVKMVINTHLHTDHIGCNRRFDVKKYADPDLSKNSGKNDYQPCPSQISKNISMIKTPGHCPGHISVVFNDGGKVVVASGDAIPTKNNYIERVPPRLHTDRAEAMRSFYKIVEIADIIIPGHDEPFFITSD
ncbi:MAG: MBL fold metallo-hydrolase [Halobacteriota archaeon]|nr:MBL fold metallo-hydrolase [Halobacteriota archaeon]